MGAFTTNPANPLNVPQQTGSYAPSRVDTAYEEEKKEIYRLRTNNELYEIFFPEWRVYVLAYEGGPSICSSEFVFQHQRENSSDYADRVRRLHYHNYCDSLVDFFSNFIFAETIHRNGGAQDEWYQRFITNVDGKGNDVGSFMKNWENLREIYGMVYVQVDSPVPSEEILTREDESTLSLNPYWILIPPVEVTDWYKDDFDQLLYLKRKQLTEILTGKVKRKIERYTEFEMQTVTVTDVDVSEIDKPTILSVTVSDNTLGYIPFHCEVFKPSLQYPQMGNSFLRDLAHNNIEILNLTSLAQDFLYKQCFNVLAKESDGSIPLAGNSDEMISTSNVMEVPKGAKMPIYVSPPAEPAQHLASRIDYIKNDMFRRAAQDTLNELFNGEGASGFSQAQSFSKTVPFIANRADVCQKAEIRLMEITMQRINKLWDGKVKYKDRYEITNMNDMLTQLALLSKELQMPSESFVREELKRVVDEFDGQIAPDVKQQIYKELSDFDFKEWMKTQKEALVGLEKQATPATSAGTGTGTNKTGTTAEASATSSKKPTGGK